MNFVAKNSLNTKLKFFVNTSGAETWIVRVDYI